MHLGCSLARPAPQHMLTTCINQQLQHLLSLSLSLSAARPAAADLHATAAQPSRHHAQLQEVTQKDGHLVEFPVPKEGQLGQDVEPQVEEAVEQEHPAVQRGQAQLEHALRHGHPVRLAHLQQTQLRHSQACTHKAPTAPPVGCGQGAHASDMTPTRIQQPGSLQVLAPLPHHSPEPALDPCSSSQSRLPGLSRPSACLTAAWACPLGLAVPSRLAP